MGNLKRIGVILFLNRNIKIEGSATLGEGFRVSDYLNKEKLDFFPLTEVVVSDWDGNVILETDFLCINKHRVMFAKHKEG